MCGPSAIRLLVMAIIIVAAASCSKDENAVIAPSTTIQSFSKISHNTVAPPSNYGEATATCGSRVRIQYPTFDYVSGTDTARITEAYIYLPPGYDENPDTRYNIIYFVHGYGQNHLSFLYEYNGLLGNVIDNMINNGDIEPVIMVFPTFNYNNVVPETLEVAGDYAKGLSREVARDLIPYVESRYRTYATATNHEGIIDSRDHRAFGGFSMGGVTTWFVFDYCMDYFRYYIPISGCCWSIGYRGGKYRADETASHLSKQVINSKFGSDGVRIYAASGTNDMIYTEVETQVRCMLLYNDTFTPRNLYYFNNIGANHLWTEVQDYLFTILPLIFPLSPKAAY